MAIKHIVKKQGGFRVSFNPLDDESDHKDFIFALESALCKDSGTKHAYTVHRHGRNVIDVDVHCGHVTESDIYELYDNGGHASQYDKHLLKVGIASVGAGLVAGNVLKYFSPLEHPKIEKAIEAAKSKSRNFFSGSE